MYLMIQYGVQVLMSVCWKNSGWLPIFTLQLVPWHGILAPIQKNVWMALMSSGILLPFDCSLYQMPWWILALAPISCIFLNTVCQFSASWTADWCQILKKSLSVLIPAGLLRMVFAYSIITFFWLFRYMPKVWDKRTKNKLVSRKKAKVFFWLNMMLWYIGYSLVESYLELDWVSNQQMYIHWHWCSLSPSR